jgi:fumarate reductase subunit C
MNKKGQLGMFRLIMEQAHLLIFGVLIFGVIVLGNVGRVSANFVSYSGAPALITQNLHIVLIIGLILYIFLWSR